MAKKNPWTDWDDDEILVGTGTGFEPYKPPEPKPMPDYQSPWKSDIDKLLGDIRDRKPFNFDINGDAIFQALRNQAIVGGKGAMADTMAKATAATGGMNNSYAQAVGQQAYNAYLQGLNAHIPGIVGEARARYDREGADMRDQLSLYLGLDRDAYGKHRDQLEDQRYQERLDHDRWAENQEYIRQENAKAEADKNRAYDRLYDLIANHGYQPSQQELDYAGMYQGEADALLNSWQQDQADREAARYSRYSGGSGDGGSYVEEPQDDGYGDIFVNDDGMYDFEGSGSSPLPATPSYMAQPDVFSVAADAKDLMDSGASTNDIMMLLDSAVSDGYITTAQKGEILRRIGFFGHSL